MNEQSFLIVHGLGGSGTEHWQTWLAAELRKRNYHVCYPTFSQFDSPNRDVWMEELNRAIQTIPADSQLTVITHSLGCFLWLHYAAAQNKRIAQQVILVAPPSPTNVLTEAKSFYPVPLLGKHLSNSAEDILFIHSTNDPYCNMEDAQHYLNLAHRSFVLPNAGHINTASGHREWSWMLDLCLTDEKLAVTI
ncbi:RBBP9/YdeN family alpha/beta hydrolase [Neobacillus jeddahensis]|uniref:RBBP9/YdeN family alpha/beta hydrolase n=1 Tax=Neobacillus jeddahensis TaxID=1461580 RepID=UPI0005AA39C5|nr:alpha/beta fold hydrolase [Neobacillus jeddahensis]